jgi:hypothetical protein
MLFLVSFQFAFDGGSRDSFAGQNLHLKFGHREESEISCTSFYL